MNSSIEDKLRAATRVPQPRPEFLAGLRAQLAAERPQPISFSERLRMTFRRTSTIVMLSVMTILLAAFVIIGPQKVIAAVQQLIGYIPGIGFVENTATVRVLAEPVAINQDGVMVTVEEAVADTSSTRINLRLDGPSDLLRYYKQPGSEVPEGPRRLILADGTEIALRSWGVQVAKSWLTFQMLFDPLPANVYDATLIFNPTPGSPTGKWQISLHFRSGQNDERMTEATLVGISSKEVNGITLTLENIAQTDGIGILKVSLKTDDADLYLDPNWENSLTIVDQAGNKLLLSPTAHVPEYGAGAVTLQTPILIPGKMYLLKLSGPIIAIRSVPYEDTANHFSLDLGANPQPGQSWKLDQTLIAAGKQIHLNGAHLLAGNVCGSSYSTETTTSLVFDFDQQPEVVDLMVITTDATAKPWRIYQGACIVYPEAPSGLLGFKISNISFPIEGNWEITWQAPTK